LKKPFIVMAMIFSTVFMLCSCGNHLSEEEQKAIALTNDKVLFDTLIQSEKHMDSLFETISNTDTINYDLYSQISTIKNLLTEQKRQVWRKIDAEDNEPLENYTEAVLDYIRTADKACLFLMLYIESGDYSNLKSAEKFIGNLDNIVWDIIAKRCVYLESEGFTEDEILELLGQY